MTRELTIDDALKGFTKECYTVLLEAGWEEDRFEVPGLQVGDSHFVLKFRKMVCVSHRKYREATTDNLIAAAVQWLAGKTLADKHGVGLVLFKWPTDPLRWLLEEVCAQLKMEK